MKDSVVQVCIRPVSNYDLRDVRISCNLRNGDFNSCVRHALTLVKRQFKKVPVIRFDVVSIDVF